MSPSLRVLARCLALSVVVAAFSPKLPSSISPSGIPTREGTLDFGSPCFEFVLPLVTVDGAARGSWCDPNRDFLGTGKRVGGTAHVESAPLELLEELQSRHSHLFARVEKLRSEKTLGGRVAVAASRLDAHLVSLSYQALSRDLARRGIDLLGEVDKASSSHTKISLEGSVQASITGTVTDAATGLPIANEGYVLLYDAGGSYVGLDRTDGVGVYSFVGLPTGTFFVRTDFDAYFDELYDDLPCPISCDVTAGTPVSVTFGATTSGVDFGLGEAPNDFTLEVSKTGPGSGTVTSSPSGIACGAACSAAFLAGSSVLLAAKPSFGSEFGGWSGDPDCSDGSISMVSNKSCSARFDLCSLPSVVNLPAQEVGGSQAFEACNKLTAGAGGFRVLGTADVTFRAGNQVVLEPGFEVRAGGTLHVLIGTAVP